jgi:large subunit ribosomal protein L29
VTRPAELRDLEREELLERLDSAREELFNLRFQQATGQLDDQMTIKRVRHDVARILTILRERELDEMEQAGSAAPTESGEVES